MSGERLLFKPASSRFGSVAVVGGQSSEWPFRLNKRRSDTSTWTSAPGRQPSTTARPRSL